MLASRTSCTNTAQAGFFVGTGTPLEQVRPGIDNKFADSASASAAFSTATQPPNVLVSGSVDIPGSASRATAAGNTLIATSRPSFVSVARYTSPIPPAPSCAGFHKGRHGRLDSGTRPYALRRDDKPPRFLPNRPGPHRTTLLADRGCDHRGPPFPLQGLSDEPFHPDCPG
jgi:hypothetical protein